MELLTELLALQHQRGYVDDESLRELAQRKNVPLYRLEGLVSFYTHFRRTPPAATTFQVCRDVVCCMFGGDEHAEQLRTAAAGRDVAARLDTLRPHLIDSEGLKLFAFVWEPVNSTVNDHEEQLRVELKPIRPARQTRAKRV